MTDWAAVGPSDPDVRPASEWARQGTAVATHVEPAILTIPNSPGATLHRHLTVHGRRIVELDIDVDLTPAGLNVEVSELVDEQRMQFTLEIDVDAVIAAALPDRQLRVYDDATEGSPLIATLDYRIEVAA